MGRKNNCIDISSNKQALILHVKISSRVKKGKPKERNWISSYSSTKQCQKTISKQKYTERNRIANLCYVEIEMKRLITKKNKANAVN